MNGDNLKTAEKWLLTVVVVGIMLLVVYCAGPADHGALPMETYDRDIIGGR